MNELTKQAYLDKIGAQLTEWGARVGLAKAKIQNDMASGHVQIRKEIDTWHEQETALKGKMEDLRTAGIEKFDDMKTGLQSLADTLFNLTSKLEDEKNGIKQ